MQAHCTHRRKTVPSASTSRVTSESESLAAAGGCEGGAAVAPSSATWTSVAGCSGSCAAKPACAGCGSAGSAPWEPPTCCAAAASPSASACCAAAAAVSGLSCGVDTGGWATGAWKPAAGCDVASGSPPVPSHTLQEHHSPAWAFGQRPQDACRHRCMQSSTRAARMQILQVEWFCMHMQEKADRTRRRTRSPALGAQDFLCGGWRSGWTAGCCRRRHAQVQLLLQLLVVQLAQEADCPLQRWLRLRMAAHLRRCRAVVPELAAWSGLAARSEQTPLLLHLWSQ